MMCRQTKIWVQKDQQFSRFVRNSHIWLYEPSLWPWTWRQQIYFLAWHSSPWWCITIPRLVTKGSAVQEMSLRWTFTGILNPSCDLYLHHNGAIQSFHKTIQLMISCHQTKWFKLQKDQQVRRYIRKSSLVTWSFTVALTLTTANQYFWKTIWLMMMHHHTKFGSIYKVQHFRRQHQGKQSFTFWSCAVTLTPNTAI